MKLRTIAAAIGAVTVLGCAYNTIGGSDDEPATVTVPNLAGNNMETVYDQLKDAGLEGSSEGGNWGDDYVAISTAPTAGTTVARYSKVNILAASRKELDFYAKPMPKLIGTKWLDLASGVTDGVYHRITIDRRKAKGREKDGVVVEQSPKAGTKMKLGEQLRVVVTEEDYGDSSGGGTWNVPNGNVNGPNICRRSRWC